MSSFKIGDKVVFAKSQKEELQSMVYEITALDEDSVTIKLLTEPTACVGSEPHEHIYDVSLERAEEVGMRLAKK